MALEDSFKWKGYFFLPNKPESELPGILSFELSKGIELELFGNFIDYQNPSSKERNIILGFSSNGKKVTLLNCFEYSRSMSLPGIPESVFSAIFLFVGEHFYSLEDICFDSCSLAYKDLNYWLNVSGFEKTQWDEECKAVTIKYKQPDRIPFDISEQINGEIEFGFNRPFELFKPLVKASIEQLPRIMLNGVGAIHFDSYWHTIQTISSFLAINYYGYPVIQSFEFYINREKLDEYDNEISKVELYFDIKSTPKKYRDHTHATRFLIEYADYGGCFSRFFLRWYQLQNEIEASIKTLTECLMERGNPIEMHFISLVQAIENLHRKTTKNKVSLLVRLTTLLSNLPKGVVHLILKNEIDFEERIKDNRNFYTHHSSDKKKFKPASLSELFTLSEKLKIILMLAILKELGFTDQKITELISRKGVYLFNHIVGLNIDQNISRSS